MTPPSIFLVITDNSPLEKVREIIKIFNSLIGFEMAKLLPITNTDAEKLNPDYEKDFGYSHTDAAINYLLENEANYKCDFFLFTNGDNLYSNKFIDDYLQHDFEDGYDIIIFDFISRYQSTIAGSWGDQHDDGTRKVVQSKFQRRYIDLGAFVIRASLMKEDPNLRFVETCRNTQYGFFEADGYLIEASVRKPTKNMVHRQVLMVHQ
ncbi:hypothetical protein HDU91_006738 [Kappamyces sp. JEL0680]|nr:hypothetical protein HDU91_006738 [Kappamyces sp. JEL0680]